MNQIPSKSIFVYQRQRPDILPATVYIINGAPRAGKNTLIKMMSDYYDNFGYETHEFSSIDPVRTMLTELGIDTSAKTAADRKLLATIGDAVEEHSNFRSNACIYEVNEAEALAGGQGCAAVFLHIREPAVIAKVTDQLHQAGRQVWRVQLISNRSEAPTNPTDANTANGAYDYIVQNFGTLDDLGREARALVNLASLRPIPAEFTHPIQSVTPKKE